MEKIKEICKPAIDLIAGWFNLSEDISFYVLLAVAALVVILIIVIICGCASSAKKRKAKKQNASVGEANCETEVINVEEKKQEEINAREAKEDEELAQRRAEEKAKAEEEARVKAEEEAKAKEEAKAEEKVEEEKPQEYKEIKPAAKKAKAKKEEVVEPVEEEETVEETKSTKTTRVVLGKYEVFPISDAYQYRLKASNGEIMVISEIYTSEAGAVAAIDTVKKNAEDGEIQIHKDKHDLWQFKLLAKNKRVIVSSANYQTQARCESAANSFKRFAAISPVVVLDEDPDHLMERITIGRIEDKAGGKIIIEKDDEGFDFKLLANNHAILCTSISFKTRAAVENAIVAAKDALNTGKLFVTSDKNGICQFKLYAESGRVLLTGESYKTKSLAINASNSFVSFINLAVVEE